MSTQIRIASGIVTAYDLLNNDNYLVTRWTRQTDMTSSDFWLATQPTTGATRLFVSGLELGSGGYYGKYTTTIEFFHTTPLMRQYIENTIMDGNGIGVVTIAVHNPLHTDYQVYYGELVSPFSFSTNSGIVREDDERYSNVQYTFRRGIRLVISYLLLENGDNLLMENNDVFILENQ